MEKNKDIRFLKNLCQFIVLLVLINPITLYLLFKSIIAVIIVLTVTIGTYLVISYYPFLSRAKLYFFNLLLLISVAYHMELIFTINFPERVIPNCYQIEHNYYFNKPYLTEHFTDPEYSILYLTSGQGYRIDEYTNPDVEVHTCDWLFIGDSYTQGAQVNYDDLFTTQLYRYFPDKIILNAGISGYSIVDEYNYYTHEGYKLRPQKVFLQLCIFNDFMNVSESCIGLKEYLMQYSNLYRYFKYNSMYANPEELPLRRFTEPFYPTEQGNKAYNIFYTSSSEQKEKDIKELAKYLRKFKEATDRYGAELCVLLIPTKEQVSYPHFKEVVEAFRIDVEKLDMQYPNKLIKRLSEEIGFSVIDTYDKLNDGDGFPFFEKDEHLSKAGHEKVAKIIYDEYQYDAHTYTYVSSQNTSDRYPTYMRHTQSILYQSFVNGSFQVLMMDSVYQKIPLLPFTSENVIHPVLSPDGKWLAYTEGDQETGRTNVVLYNTENQIVRYITEGENEYGAIPSFNATGQYIAYPSWRGERKRFSNPVIVLYNIQTGEKQTLTEDDYESWRPVFHPTAPLLYFITKAYQQEFAITSLNLCTNEKKIVVKEKYNIWDPAISPDGNWMLFSGYKDNNWDIFLYDFKEETHVQLTYTKGDEWDAVFGVDENDIWFGGVFGMNNGIYNLKK